MFFSSSQRRWIAGLEMTGTASAGPHFAQDRSQWHVNRDVKQKGRDGKKKLFSSIHSSQPSVTGGMGQQCEKDCQKHTGCTGTPADHLGRMEKQPISA